MSTFYAVQATIEATHGEWTGNRQVPTFYLNADVQGIVSVEHAERIAIDILSNGGHVNRDGERYHVTVAAV